MLSNMPRLILLVAGLSIWLASEVSPLGHLIESGKDCLKSTAIVCYIHAARSLSSILGVSAKNAETEKVPSSDFAKGVGTLSLSEGMPAPDSGDWNSDRLATEAVRQSKLFYFWAYKKMSPERLFLQEIRRAYDYLVASSYWPNQILSDSFFAGIEMGESGVNPHLSSKSGVGIMQVLPSATEDISIFLERLSESHLPTYQGGKLSASQSKKITAMLAGDAEMGRIIGRLYLFQLCSDLPGAYGKGQALIRRIEKGVKISESEIEALQKKLLVAYNQGPRALPKETAYSKKCLKHKKRFEMAESLLDRGGLSDIRPSLVSAVLIEAEVMGGQDQRSLIWRKISEIKEAKNSKRSPLDCLDVSAARTAYLTGGS